MYDPIKPYKKDISELIKQTWQTPYVSIEEGIYPSLERKFLGLEIDHTDGIGTKGFYHWQEGTLKEAVLDALAMNLNDLAIVGAVPYKLQDHILVPEEDERIIKIIKFLVDECKKRTIAITGGEISFQKNINGLDISLTVSGFIENRRSNKFKAGDVLLGIESSGLHSNGFTKVREIFGSEIKPEFTIPTNIYLDTIIDLNKRFDIHGMCHITGGAYTKLKELLNECDAVIRRSHSLKPHKIFHELHERGVLDEEMYKTFNCGVGFILSIAQKDVEGILRNIRDFKADIIGKVITGNRKVIIESNFSNRELIF